MKKNFFKSAEFYQSIYNQKDYSYESAFILKLLKKRNIFSGNMIEFGSGIGSHAKYLNLKSPFFIEGYELSPSMLMSSYKSKKFKPNLGDMRFSGKSNYYDCGISVFHVMSYLYKEHDLNLFFKNLYRVLKPSALFFFDYWSELDFKNKKSDGEPKTFINKKQIIKRSTFVHQTKYKKTLKILFKYSIKTLSHDFIGKFQETHYMRSFSDKDIFDLLNKHGFKLIKKGYFPEKKIFNNHNYRYSLIQKNVQ